MANLQPGATDRAHALFGDFIEGRWEQKRGEFLGHLDAGRIADRWAHVGAAGASTTWANRFARQVGQYNLVKPDL